MGTNRTREGTPQAKGTSGYDTLTLNGIEYKLAYPYALVVDDGRERPAMMPAVIAGWDLDEDGTCMLRVSYLDMAAFAHSAYYTKDNQIMLHTKTDDGTHDGALATGASGSACYALVDLREQDPDTYERMLDECAYRASISLLHEMGNKCDKETTADISFAFLARRIECEYEKRVADMPWTDAHSSAR